MTDIAEHIDRDTTGNKEIKLLFYCTVCRKYIAHKNVLQAVGYRAMCPFCYDIHPVPKYRINGKLCDEVDMLNYREEKYARLRKSKV